MSLLVLLGVVVFLADTQAEYNKPVNQMSIVDKLQARDNFGVATNCGKSAASAVWTPKDISPAGELTLYFNVTTPYDMSGGYGEVDIYNHIDHSVVTMYGTPFTCADIQQYVTCPLKKGQFITKSYTFTDLSALSQYIGTFDIVVQINNDLEQEMLCMNATVNIVI